MACLEIDKKVLAFYRLQENTYHTDKCFRDFLIYYYKSNSELPNDAPAQVSKECFLYLIIKTEPYITHSLRNPNLTSTWLQLLQRLPGSCAS